jgi:uncharacterized protein YndB with AHSA1/START domain
VIKTKISVRIHRPVDEVFAYVTTLENFPRWMGALVRASAQTSPGPVGAGTTFTQINHFLGRDFDTQFKVITYEPPHQFCVVATAGVALFGGCYMFEPVEGGTQLTSTAEVEGGGLFSLAGSLLIRAIRHQTESGLARLQQLLDTERDRGA